MEPQHIHKNRVAVKEFPKVIYSPFLLNPWLYRHLKAKLSFYISLKQTPGLLLISVVKEWIKAV